jgi:hypothetical protein
VCLQNAEHYRDEGLADVCGKCSSGVPCATANPVSQKQDSVNPERTGRP